MSKEEKCCAGCKIYSGEETRHIKECVFYPESFSKMYDDLDKKHEDAQFVIGEYERQIEDLSSQLTAVKEALREIIKECEEWVVPGAENSNNCENNHYVDIDDLKSLITKAKTLIENWQEESHKNDK